MLEIKKDISVDSANCRPRYQDRIEKFIDVVGRVNVQIRPFDPHQLVGRDVVRDFLWHVLKQTPEQLDLDIVRVNEGLDNTSAYVLESLNRQVPAFVGDYLNPRRAKSFVKCLQDAGRDERFTLADFDWRKFTELVAEDVDWLSNATRGSIDYSNTEIPDVAQQKKPNLNIDPLARALNDQCLAAERAQQRQIILSGILACREQPFSSLNIDSPTMRAAMAHSDPNFILNTVHRLRNLGYVDLALQLATNIKRITPSRSHHLAADEVISRLRCKNARASK